MKCGDRLWPCVYASGVTRVTSASAPRCGNTRLQERTTQVLCRVRMSSYFAVYKGFRRRYLVLFRCPNCGKPLKFSVLRAGTVGSCKRCQSLVAIPGQKERRLVIRNELANRRRENRATPLASCPFCEAAIRARSARCTNCKEQLDIRQAPIDLTGASTHFAANGIIAYLKLVFSSQGAGKKLRRQ